MALLALLVLPVASASAQEKGQVGLAMGYPSSIAVVFHFNDSLALRPDFSFVTASSTSTSSSGSTTGDNDGIAVGLSALFYAAKWDNLRAYVTPRFGYARTTSGYVNPSGETGHSSTSSTYSFAGSLGAQYSLGRRFAVFGEMGVGYAHQTGENSYDVTMYVNTSTTSSGNTWSIRTAVGGIFYVK